MARSMHGAVRYAYGPTSDKADWTVGCVRSTIQFMPLPRCCHLSRLLAHIRKNCFWKRDAYSMWLLLESCMPDGIASVWCHDSGAVI